MSPQPGSMGGQDGRLWWRPALAMFAVGYGANQFVPLLSVYRRSLHLSDAQATAVFGVYAFGLIPGLLLGGRASDRYGRRPLMLAFTALSLIATAVLITGQWGPGGLYAGRLLTGVVSGTVFTVGTAWVKELSSGAAPGTGARRAAVALTAGFGVGPLVAGPLAQWAPAPEVLPYLVHLVLAAATLALLPGAPETRTAGPPTTRRPRLLPAAASSARFRRLVLPLGPWVFGSGRWCSRPSRHTVSGRSQHWASPFPDCWRQHHWAPASPCSPGDGGSTPAPPTTAVPAQPPSASPS